MKREREREREREWGIKKQTNKEIMSQDNFISLYVQIVCQPLFLLLLYRVKHQFMSHTIHPQNNLTVCTQTADISFCAIFTSPQLKYVHI